MSRGLIFVLALAACGDDMVSSQPVLDAALVDAASVDAAPIGAQLASVNGCTPELYEDHTAANDPRTIQIAARGLSYSPKCMLIAVGQSVRFEGSLSAHPLAPGNAEQPAVGSPILATSSGSDVSFGFPVAGTYPYYCTEHSFGAGLGMAGVIVVR